MKRRYSLAPAQIIVLGFLLLIALGTALLMLPFSSREAGSTPFETAVFTATSASCVTGLVIEDTAQYWTGFGQAVILCLIQIGGMGVVTMAILIIMFSGKKIGLKQRWIMQESISAPSFGGIVRLTGMILCVTLALEACGAALLALRFCPQLGIGKGIWYAVFHSVSAFCNAGFDLMGFKGAPCVSLTAYTGDALVNIVLMFLILAGGIGFVTWQDMRTQRFNLHRYTLQSKLILSATVLLLMGGFCFNYFYEFNLPQWDALSAKTKVIAAMFQTVTPRTAGFNTVELNKLSPAGQLFTLLMMLIGGAPGSTAGGFKLTTFAVLLLCIRAAFRGKSSPEIFGRRISNLAVRSAAALFIVYLLLFIFAAFVLTVLDGVPLMAALFETASAIATVGLSMGITSSLCPFSHAVLALLMYFGRVGGLTLIYAAAAGESSSEAKFPEEPVAIG